MAGRQEAGRGEVQSPSADPCAGGPESLSQQCLSQCNLHTSHQELVKTQERTLEVLLVLAQEVSGQ